MTGADVLAALAAAGAVFVVDGNELLLDAPPSVPLELVRAAREHRDALRVVATGAWRAEILAWPARMREDFEERAAIREFDGGQAHDLAERAAFLEVRERALEPAAAVLAACAALLGARLETVRSSAP